MDFPTKMIILWCFGGTTIWGIPHKRQIEMARPRKNITRLFLTFIFIAFSVEFWLETLGLDIHGISPSP